MLVRLRDSWHHYYWHVRCSPLVAAYRTVGYEWLKWYDGLVPGSPRRPPERRWKWR